MDRYLSVLVVRFSLLELMLVQAFMLYAKIQDIQE
jgi:hypothetical protein